MGDVEGGLGLVDEEGKASERGEVVGSLVGRRGIEVVVDLELSCSLIPIEIRHV